MNTHQQISRESHLFERIGRHIDLIVPTILSIIAAVAIFISRGFPKTAVSTDTGAGYFPLLYSSMLIMMCSLLAANHWLSRHKQQREKAQRSHVEMPEIGQKTAPQYFKTVIGIVATFICLLLMPVLGYTLVTLAYMIGTMWRLGYRHPLWNPVIAVLVTAVLYGTFAWGLQVPLPVGMLFE